MFHCDLCGEFMSDEEADEHDCENDPEGAADQVDWTTGEET